MGITMKDFILICKTVRTGVKPENWNMIDLSMHDGNFISRIFMPNFDAFPIRLYYRSGTREAVLAFSSTQQKPSQLWADFLLAIEKTPPICDSFQTIMNKIREILGSNIDLHVTGFSLGATLAEIFAAQFELPAVTFDGTGSKTIIRKLFSNAETRTEKIHTYLTSPTQVNTLQEHVGNIFYLKLFPEDEQFNPSIDKLKSLTIYTAKNWWLHPFIVDNILCRIAATLDYLNHSIYWLANYENWSTMQHSIEHIERLLGSHDDFPSQNCIPMKTWPTRISFLFDTNFYEQIRNKCSGNTCIKVYDLIQIIPGYEENNNRMSHNPRKRTVSPESDETNSACKYQKSERSQSYHSTLFTASPSENTTNSLPIPILVSNGP